ncbi:MAG: hypothetical protein A3B68_02795 [Candidatus Melainabacteria bacterium RIFCSPHIGHO2_02_FULL_34_12]|nr:MAG: hypothetical protein A3B68_02795 [Candidatus Melainabacteria bacterium RIFCSPHIGHO2_02_FULL_34_12]
MAVTTQFNALFSTSEIKELFGFEIQGSNEFSLSTDSRSITKDQIFIPLFGEKFDGHDFINDVMDRNVRACHGKPLPVFCQQDKLFKVQDKYKSNLILVENTLEAYQKLANYHRKKLKAKVITITGSSGKTTVKELIASVLSQKYKVHKTEANYNNEIGVPKTILETTPDTEVLVLELAMRAKGEIRLLSEISEPDIAIIINVGSAHIGRLGSLSNIIEAKCEIFEHVKKGGIGIIHKNGQLIDYLNTKDLKNINDFIKFDISDLEAKVLFKDGKSKFILDGEEYFINAQGKTHILNSILVIKLAKKLGLNKNEIQNGLSKFKIPEGRGNVLKIKDEVYIIDESYNANPDSLKAAVLNLVDSWSEDYKKVLVIGELAELGEQQVGLLTELGIWLRDKPIYKLITVGTKLNTLASSLSSKNVANVANTDECCAILNDILVPKTVALIKGSHVAGLNKVINYFLK